MPVSEQVELHYGTAGIAERILAALRAEIGERAPVTPDALAPLDHFHGRGVLATKEIAALLAPKAGERVLDIGCGIGGPARWIADKFGCHVTGVDLTAAFCRAAEMFNAATGMADRVRILQGNALALPLEPDSFDRAYSQNVIMNIADKVAFYREALRVLRPGGVLALSNVCIGPNGPPYFPVPWAETPETSFLATVERTRQDIEAAGFAIDVFRETTAEARTQMAAQRKRLEAEGYPRLGLHVLMGERMKTYQVNSLRTVEDGRARLVEVLARKMG
jgi:ubiquinone/menaquinone biosynthesis C-methylase UbiE